MEDGDRIEALRGALERSQNSIVALHQSRLARLFHAYDTTLGRMLPARPPGRPGRAGPPLPPGRLGGPGRGRDVVVFPAIPWGYRRQRIHHIAGRFAAAGHRVFYLGEPGPLGPPYEARRKDGVFQADLRCPSRLDVYKGEISGPALAALESSFGSLEKDARISSPLLYVAFPTWQPLAEKLAGRGALVYDCADDVSGFPNVSAKRIREERKLAGSADLVVCSSRPLYEQKRALAKKCALVPNGCDYDHFAGGRGGILGAPGPVVGYFGAVAEWFDTGLVESAARRRPAYTFVLIGDTYGADVRGLMSTGNVRVLGERPYEELPEYLRDFDACMIPFKAGHRLARAASPIKLYEYMAGAKPVVSARLPELEGLGCLLYDGADDFVEKLDAALAMGPEERARLADFARANTWDLRFGQLRSALP